MGRSRTGSVKVCGASVCALREASVCTGAGELLSPASSGASCLFGVRVFAPSIMKTEQTEQGCCLWRVPQQPREAVRRHTLVKGVFPPLFTTQRLVTTCNAALKEKEKRHHLVLGPSVAAEVGAEACAVSLPLPRWQQESCHPRPHLCGITLSGTGTGDKIHRHRNAAFFLTGFF